MNSCSIVTRSASKGPLLALRALRVTMRALM